MCRTKRMFKSWLFAPCVFASFALLSLSFNAFNPFFCSPLGTTAIRAGQGFRRPFFWDFPATLRAMGSPLKSAQSRLLFYLFLDLSLLPTIFATILLEKMRSRNGHSTLQTFAIWIPSEFGIMPKSSIAGCCILAPLRTIQGRFSGSLGRNWTTAQLTSFNTHIGSIHSCKSK